MRLVTYTFRGTTRTGAMLDDHDVVDLSRAETLRLTQAGDESPQGRAAFNVSPEMLAFLRAGVDLQGCRMRATNQSVVLLLLAVFSRAIFASLSSARKALLMCERCGRGRAFKSQFAQNLTGPVGSISGALALLHQLQRQGRILQ